ncbi:AAA family ATPase [Yersinia intermedia]|uniref:AAA family ATPase n=1 Tax=Yersinia intermedia TaxID=631 RepID=UPI0022FDD1E3|nr:AAA family ATPase [Yersinia intermedia]MDA5479693.1 AAA family ATPase [Yersinia intermedia]
MLTHIDITNFKSIESECLKLAPLTILTGANSSGKSSVIQALMLLIMNSAESNRFSMEGVIRYLNEFVNIRNKKTNAKFIEVNLKDSNNLTHHIRITNDGIDKSTSVEYQYEPLKYKEVPEILYLNANRLGAQDIIPLSDRRVGNLGEFLFSTFDKIKIDTVDDSLVKFENSKTISYQVAEWLSFITGTTSELVTERIGDQVKVSFSIKDLEGYVSPFNLGAGMSYISKVIIICLMAKKGDLVLLENPEIQLHPKAQAHLGVFLTFIARSGIQLIVETHCEHLLNKIAYQVFEDEFPADEVIIHYKPDVDKKFISLMMDDNGNYNDLNGSIVSFPKGFFDATLDDLLSMR